MNLVDNLRKHINNTNAYIINDLVDILIEERINSIEELEKYEKDSNSNQSTDEIVKLYLHDIDTYVGEYDNCNLDSMKKLKELRGSIDSSDDGIKALILYCSLTNRDNPFPYITYQLIINNKL